jgi:uncharacterized protein YhaN
VNLLRCHIQGFGRLAQVALRFEPGLNVIFAGNEVGKTTLQRFLVSLLYGQLRADLKTHRRLEPWVPLYKPWHVPDYGGILWCSLANGRELELKRTFGKEDASFEIRTAGGEDITRTYEVQRNGEVLFARTHLGLPKELFESIAVIRESRALELLGKDSIRDRIANLSQSGDEELSVRQSLDRLDTALKAIGSESAPTRPFRQMLDSVAALQEEKAELERRREEFQHWMEERANLATRVARLESEVDKARNSVAAARLRETAARVRALEDLDQELRDIRLQLEINNGDGSFPAQELEKLTAELVLKENLERQLAATGKLLAATSARLAQVDRERRGLLQYSELDSSAETEKKITEWFVGYLSLSFQKDEAQRTITALNEESASLDRALAEHPAFAPPDADWEKKAREAADEERAAARKSIELNAKIGEHQASLKQVRAKAAVTRRIAALLFVSAALVAAARFALPYLPIPWAGVLAGCALLAASAVACVMMGARARSRIFDLETAARRIQAEHQGLLEQGGPSQRALHKAMSESGFSEIEPFLEEAKKYEHIRRRRTECSTALNTAQQNRNKVDAECGQVYSRLKESLAKVGLACSPGNLKAQIDILRGNLRKYREVNARYQEISENLRISQGKERELTEEAARNNALICHILKEAGVDSPEAFRDACRRRQRMLDLKDKAASRTREYESLCGVLTMEEWREQLRQMTADQGEPAAQQPLPEGGMPLLPYYPTSEEAEEEEKRATAALSAAREEYATIAERVHQAFNQYRAISEIDEDLSLANQKLRELARNRDALTLAAETIRTLSREQQEILAPQLNRAVEQRFLRLCEGRYDEVKIDPDLRIVVREKGTAELRQSDSLSHGTQDQLYFALRFGILDLVSSPEEDSPSFLDEPFAAYDRSRMEEALRILRDEASRRQLLLFTCREDLLTLAQAEGANVITMSGAGMPDPSAG